MRSWCVSVVAVALAACGQPKQPPENQLSANEKTTAATANAAANSAGATASETARSSAENGVPTLPPSSAAPRFVGTWATNKANCTSKPWRFTEKALTVEGGPQCSFYHVTTMPGGYDVAAECPTKQPVHTDLIKLRFAESAQAMLVESNAINPTGLIYCGK
jgi:hypothetical protein